MITHENILHEEVAKLTQEIVSLKELITNRGEFKKKLEEPPEFMNLDKLLWYLDQFKGLKLSKSLIYKMSSSGGIPFRKAGNHLIFLREEIDAWHRDRLEATTQTTTNNAAPIIASAAMKKLKN